MEKIEIPVDKCDGCPFSERDYGENTASCYAPVEVHAGRYNIMQYYDTQQLAPFCPLKNKELIIKTV